MGGHVLHGLLVQTPSSSTVVTHARRRIAIYRLALGEQSGAECSLWCSPMLSSILKHYSDFTWSIASCGRKAQD